MITWSVALVAGLAAVAVGCAAPTATPPAETDLGSAFGTPVKADAKATADAAKADAVATADGDAVATETLVDTPRPGDDDATADSADEGETDTAALPEDGLEDAEEDISVADIGPDVTKPDIVIADAKGDAKGDTGADTAGAVTFGAVYTGVIKSYGCAATYCHAALFSTADGAYLALTTGKSATTECNGAAFVVKGKPAESLLWQKLAPGKTTCGAPMPSGVGDKLISSADLQLVTDWIAGGAKK